MAMTSIRVALLTAFLGVPSIVGVAAETTASISLADQVSGTWVLQQVSTRDELERLTPRTILPALKTPHIRGFCLRVPWNAVDQDFSLLKAGRELATRHGIDYSVRFMAGRHTPERVFEKGARFYRVKSKRAKSSIGEKVPVPFQANGKPNAVFETEYEQFVQRLASWCRCNDVRLLHLAWYGQDWAELNHGKEVRTLEGYSVENWMTAHLRLIDIGVKVTGDDLAVELPFSGYGPLTQAACRFADHVVGKLGPDSPRFFCQANGWGPRGDWGAPTEETEAAFDRVWQRSICRGQQAIQPSDFPWPELYERLYENRSTYCEVYAPSFKGERRAELAEEIRTFAKYRQNDRSVGHAQASKPTKSSRRNLTED
jgi:hypothetical protein